MQGVTQMKEERTLNTDNLTKLRIFYRNESTPEFVFSLVDNDNSGCYALGQGLEQNVELFNGENIEVYAEVRSDQDPIDISLCISQAGRDLDIRCGAGIIVSYETVEGIDLLFQIGTGTWE